MWLRLKNMIVDVEDISRILKKSKISGGYNVVMMYKDSTKEAITLEYDTVEDAEECMRQIANQLCSGHECCGGHPPAIDLMEGN